MTQIYPQSSQISPSSWIKQAAKWLYAFWKFSRPHTIIGTSLSAIGICSIAIASNTNLLSGAGAWVLPLLANFFGSWVACLCGNVYIVGLNQLEDVEIDRINKPHLPIAAGEFSHRQGQIIVGVTGILALLLAWLMGPYLLGMVSLSLGIGTAYSLPPIRLKRFPFWAALCIFGVRGVIVNLGLYKHFSWVLQGNLSIPPQVWALTLFILVFTFAIAIFKDIPDIDGDRQYNITTFTIQLGTKAVFNLALWVLTACYLGMIAAVLWLPGVNGTLLVISHLVMLSLMWWRSSRVDLHDKVAIASFYQFIWKLFFLEYLLFPTVCLLS